MSSILSDSYWLDTANFLRNQTKPSDKVLAPNDFNKIFPSITSYSNFIHTSLDGEVWWFVIHKGMIDRIGSRVIGYIKDKNCFPVFANEVFVVFCNQDQPEKLDITSNHVKPLFEKLDSLVEVDTSVQNICDFSSGNFIDVATLPIKEFSKLSRTQLEGSIRRSCQSSYLGDSTIVCRILGKYICYVDSRDASLTPHLLLNGYWESWLTQTIVSLVQPGFYCLDVGANCGYYSLIMADIVGDRGRVLSVEPNPRLSELLRKSVNVNGLSERTEVSSKAASSASGNKLNLVIPEGDFWGSATVCGEFESGVTQNYFEVETETIDELTKHCPKVDFIKVDAEGAELSIWQGMQQTIERNRDISIILEFSCLRDYDAVAFLEDIKSKGFLIQYIDDDAITKPLSIEDCLNQGGRTYWDLFLQRER